MLYIPALSALLIEYTVNTLVASVNVMKDGKEDPVDRAAVYVQDAPAQVYPTLNEGMVNDNNVSPTL